MAVELGQVVARLTLRCLVVDDTETGEVLECGLADLAVDNVLTSLVQVAQLVRQQSAQNAVLGQNGVRLGLVASCVSLVVLLQLLDHVNGRDADILANGVAVTDATGGTGELADLVVAGIPRVTQAPVNAPARAGAGR